MMVIVVRWEPAGGMNLQIGPVPEFLEPRKKWKEKVSFLLILQEVGVTDIESTQDQARRRNGGEPTGPNTAEPKAPGASSAHGPAFCGHAGCTILARAVVEDLSEVAAFAETFKKSMVPGEKLLPTELLVWAVACFWAHRVHRRVQTAALTEGTEASGEIDEQERRSILCAAAAAELLMLVALLSPTGNVGAALVGVALSPEANPLEVIREPEGMAEGELVGAVGQAAETCLGGLKDERGPIPPGPSAAPSCAVSSRPCTRVAGRLMRR